MVTTPSPHTKLRKTKSKQSLDAIKRLWEDSGMTFGRLWDDFGKTLG